MQPIELDVHTWNGLEYLEAVSGPGAIAELVGDFLQDAPGRLVRMKTALAAGEREVLARLAHDLKSNSATLGVLQLSVLAEELERTGRDGPEPDLISKLEAVESMLPGVLLTLEQRASLYP